MPKIRQVVLYEKMCTGMVDGWREWITLTRTSRGSGCLSAHKSDGSEVGTVVTISGIKNCDQLRTAWEKCLSDLMADYQDIREFSAQVSAILPDIDFSED